MIIYLLKSASCLALLLFFYHFILEKEKMHNFNRFYLLGSVLFSFIVPLATITVETINNITTFAQPIFTGNTDPTGINETLNYNQLLLGIYLLISLILLIRFGKNLFKIIQKTRKNENIKHEKAILVLVDDEILPHTFWKTIFINKKEYKEGRIEEELFTHELTHVTQKHTLDVILIELLQIIFWINPLFIFLKKAIQLNHEFLADEKVIIQHKNTFQYQHLLLNKATWNNEYYLASNLNYSLTKKRLKMMTKQSSQTKVLFKKLAVIPLLAGFIFLFAQRIEAQENGSNKVVTEYNKLAKKYNKQSKKDRVIKLKDIKRLEFLYAQLNESQKKSAQPFPDSPPMPPVDPNPGHIIIKKKKEKAIYYLDGKIISKKEVDKLNPDNIKSMNVKKDKNSSGSVYITSKKEPSFYLNGENVSKKEIDKINPDNIESVNVNKEKNGTSSVYVKQKKEPVYYLDGKIISKKEIDKLNPDNIKSMNVKKNKDGSGSIYITSKKE